MFFISLPKITKGRVMVVGPTGSGKSSLLSALKLTNRLPIKTEQVLFTPQSIDTPGEMLDIPSLYHALIISSVKAAVILFIADPTQRCAFPNKMAKVLRARCIGVITKIDLASPSEIIGAIKALYRAGVKDIFETSVVTGKGLEQLKIELNKI